MEEQPAAQLKGRLETLPEKHPETQPLDRSESQLTNRSEAQLSDQFDPQVADRPGVPGVQLQDRPTSQVADQPTPQVADRPTPRIADHTKALSVVQTETKSLEPSKTQSEDQPANPVVIVLHASVGSGHRTAANAIGQAFELLRNDPKEAAHFNADIPEDLEVEVLDVLDFGRIKFDGDATASMFTGVTRPIYDLSWRYFLTGRALWAGGTIWAHIMFPRFVTYIEEKRPLAIICTHITAANVAVSARMLSGLDFPIVCVPTDYEIEGLWPHLHTDLFCVANETMVETLRPRQIPEERIQITGIPTRLSFRATYDQKTVRNRFNLPQDRYVVLALAGAHLPRPYVHFRESIDQLLPYMHNFKKMHLVVLAGTDTEYANHTRRLVRDHELDNVTVFDYVEDIAALMSASDLLLCKAGGLTVTECLCAGTPMILMGRAYGQEKANMRMLTAAGAALHVTTFRELMDTLKHIEAHPESTQAMLINASFLRKPDAAIDIACAALRMSHEHPVGDCMVRRKYFCHLYVGEKPTHIR